MKNFPLAPVTTEPEYYGSYIISLPLAQIRAIKRAVRVLCAAGVHHEDALRFIIKSRTEGRQS